MSSGRSDGRYLTDGTAPVGPRPEGDLMAAPSLGSMLLSSTNPERYATGM